MVRPQTWEEWQIWFNRTPHPIFLDVSLILKQITCQGPKCTDRPWSPWSASPGTSTHTHRGPLLQEPHLSSGLQFPSLLFLNCYLDFLVWPWMWLVTLPFLDDCWIVDETYCCYWPALLAQLGHGGGASCWCHGAGAALLLLFPDVTKTGNTYVSTCICASISTLQVALSSVGI